MTVCIAAKFNNNRSLVLVADKQSTSQIHQTEDADKILKLSEKTYFLFAGDVKLGLSVYDQVKGLGLSTPEEWMAKVKDVVTDIRYQNAVDTILRPRGFTNETYLAAQSTLHREVALGIDNSLANYQLQPGLEIIVAGLDSDEQARIYYLGSSPITQFGDYSSGYAVVGAATQAYFILNSLKYKTSLSYKEALNAVHTTKKLCESVNGIGEKTDIVIIDNAGSRSLSAAKLTELSTAYQTVKTATSSAMTTAQESIHE